MALSTRLLPDCTGRWMCFAHFSHSAMVRKSFSVASLGWLVMKRMRKSPGMSFISLMMSAKSTPEPRSLP